MLKQTTHILRKPPTITTYPIHHLRNLQTTTPRTMSLLPHHPRPVPSLLRAFTDLDNYLTSTSTAADSLFPNSPRFDLRETKDAYILDGDLPGVKKEDVTIEFSDPSTMNVRGRSVRSTEGEDGNWWFSERAMGEFRRSFSFPAKVDREHVDAKLTDGVLSIQVPKVEEEPEEERKIVEIK
ncbi:HSP20-like chaperone [Aspergillus welwitschiae]|uniref:HSP20-like chaperone n=3 Tax=Aspergillus TaxID=5052 RepID=A0A3F3QER1_9EURO|nr:HSP20-like chaperone [Aspergillus welwitschiae]RDH37748.1 HSP20-like chaperone [Aspergillus welwitschiae]